MAVFVYDSQDMITLRGVYRHAVNMRGATNEGVIEVPENMGTFFSVGQLKDRTAWLPVKIARPVPGVACEPEHLFDRRVEVHRVGVEEARAA